MLKPNRLCSSHEIETIRTQDDVLEFVDRQAHMGGAVVEVGCDRGGLTAQLAHLCRRLGKAMYVVDVCPEYLEIAKISIRAVTGDDHVLYYRGDLAGFVKKGVCAESPTLVLVDADHRYRGVVKDIQAIFAMKPKPYAAAFHDFSLRYSIRELQDVRVDKGVCGALDNAIYRPIGEVAGQGRTLRTTPGEDSHYHEPGTRDGVLLRVMKTTCARQVRLLGPADNPRLKASRTTTPARPLNAGLSSPARLARTPTQSGNAR